MLLSNRASRYWEIDAVRGVAIVLMVVYHFLYDLKLVWDFAFDHKGGWWMLYVHITAGLFLVVVGVSLTVSYAKAGPICTQKQQWIKYLKRGVGLFALGGVITAVTWVAYPQQKVVYGILHLIGTAIILCHPLAKHKWTNLWLAAAAVGLGIFLRRFLVHTPWLVWLGIRYYNFHTMDYFPLFPWVGPVLFGLFVGNLLYANGIRKVLLPDLSKYMGVSILCLLGRYSLIIYLVHQPVLVGAMQLVRLIATLR